ncbi:hypothetical protein [Halomontanus rarus]|nr:hypothetical protein [Halovivax sp. TS33]
MRSISEFATLSEAVPTGLRGGPDLAATDTGPSVRERLLVRAV